MLIRNGAMFRREAIDFQRRRLSGNVVLRPDRPSTALCLVYGFFVCSLTAAFWLVSFPVTAHAKVQCTEPGARFLDVLRPRFPFGTVLQRAEIDAADGTPVAVWSAGRYSKLRTRRNGPAPSEQCAATYSLITRPAEAVVHRLLRGS